MDIVNLVKCQYSLPSSLVANTIYFVKTLDGFDIYLTTKGLVPEALKMNIDDLSFERISKNLKSNDYIVYDTDGVVTHVVYVVPGGQIIKYITYDVEGRATNVKLDLDPVNPDTFILQKNIAYSTNQKTITYT